MSTDRIVVFHSADGVTVRSTVRRMDAAMEALAAVLTGSSSPRRGLDEIRPADLVGAMLRMVHDECPDVFDQVVSGSTLPLEDQR